MNIKSIIFLYINYNHIEIIQYKIIQHYVVLNLLIISQFHIKFVKYKNNDII